MQNDYINMLFGVDSPISFLSILGTLLLSFVLTFLYAFVYQRTFNGFSYSRTYVQSLILGSIVSCGLVMAVGDSLARGVGVMGTLAIIRFRTLIRDPRDSMFLFACLATGIACGAGMITVAVAMTIVFNGIVFLLHIAPFASRRNYEGMLRFTAPKDAVVKEAVDRHLMMLCESFTLVAMRNAVQGELLEYSYQIRLRDSSYQKDLVKGLSEIEGVTDPLLMMQRSTVEI
jgi:uncharacterized membrane protein YhiD involved in acid resistance